MRDRTHGNCLQQIALRLLSITPHSVMPERLFFILSWPPFETKKSFKSIHIGSNSQNSYLLQTTTPKILKLTRISWKMLLATRSDQKIIVSDVTISDETAVEFQRTMK